MAEALTDKQRALRAEKQIERLERELELIRSRVKVKLNNALLFFSNLQIQ